MHRARRNRSEPAFPLNRSISTHPIVPLSRRRTHHDPSNVASTARRAWAQHCCAIMALTFLCRRPTAGNRLPRGGGEPRAGSAIPTPMPRRTGRRRGEQRPHLPRLQAWTPSPHLQSTRSDRYRRALSNRLFEWTPIAHRLFSEISKSWRDAPGTPTKRSSTTCRTTRTTTGLRVRADLVWRYY